MNDQTRKLYDRAQSLDRETDALSFRLNSVADPAERASLQAQIDQAIQRASDAWADYHDAEDAHRRCTASAGRPTAPAPSLPAPSAAEIAERRRAASRDLWSKVTKQVNEERGLGREPDAPPSASHGAPPANSQKSATKSIWSKAIAAANAGIAGGEPSASQERQASPDSRPQTDDFMSKAMVTARKHLADAGFSVAR